MPHTRAGDVVAEEHFRAAGVWFHDFCIREGLGHRCQTPPGAAPPSWCSSTRCWPGPGSAASTAGGLWGCSPGSGLLLKHDSWLGAPQMSLSPPSLSWSQLFRCLSPQEQRCGVGPGGRQGSPGSVTPLSLLQRRTGSSPTRPPCHQPLALAEDDAVGHLPATRHPRRSPAEGGSSSWVRRSRCPRVAQKCHRVRTILVEVLRLR